MKVFIAGIMQGSKKGKGIQEQDYRAQIREAVNLRFPEVEVLDPFSLFPDSVDYDDQRAKQVLFDMAAEAASSDVLIAYLPEASMGSALEMIRAYDNNKIVYCITPMKKNWFINSVSTRKFADLEDFIAWLQLIQLEDLIDPDVD